MSKCNPNGIRDGERLPIVGGPADGGYARAHVLFPLMDGGLPCACAIIDGHTYELDQKNRRWVHRGKEKTGGAA